MSLEHVATYILRVIHYTYDVGVRTVFRYKATINFILCVILHVRIHTRQVYALTQCHLRRVYSHKRYKAPGRSSLW